LANPERAALEYRFYLGDMPGIEPEWALVVGEILFNLRSALDHLAYQLHVAALNGNVPEAIERVSQFPIYNTVDGWANNLYRNLSSRDQDALHDLQPYIARNDCWEWTRHWLNLLNVWHTFDKHRKLHLVTGAKNASIIVEPDPRFPFDTDFIDGPVESKSHVETWTFSHPPKELKHHPGVFLHVAFQHDGKTNDLSVALPAMVGRVREVLDHFADRF
jgi:hypothetical protein